MCKKECLDMNKMVTVVAMLVLPVSSVAVHMPIRERERKMICGGHAGSL